MRAKGYVKEATPNVRTQEGSAKDKTICLPIAEEIDYEQLVKDIAENRAYLDSQIAQEPN